METINDIFVINELYKLYAYYMHIYVKLREGTPWRLNFFSEIKFQPPVAFPLAPLCAFLNNIFEIRIDAAKYTKYKKRTIPVRTKSIGIWYPIFRFIGLLAIITNVSSHLYYTIANAPSEFINPEK